MSSHRCAGVRPAVFEGKEVRRCGDSARSQKHLFWKNRFSKIFSGAHRASSKDRKLNVSRDARITIDWCRETVHCGSSSGATIWPSRIWMIEISGSSPLLDLGDHHDGSVRDIEFRWRSILRSDCRILRIRVPGRFVGEHDGRFVDKRSGQRYALLFSARQLRWTMRQPVVSPSNPTMRSK